MIKILAYSFMRRAFLTGGVVAIIMPLLGVFMVLRRLSMVGDSLAHSSLAGVTSGLAFGFNPILGALGSSLLSAFAIEGIRKRTRSYQEMSIAIITSLGLAIAGLLSSFVTNSSALSSYLFGSIVAISDGEMALILAIGVLVLASVIFLYRDLFYIAADEDGARISGVPVSRVIRVFTMLTALSVAIASRTVGALIVSSLMVIPVAAAIKVAKSYRQVSMYSVVFSLVATVIGLTISFYLDLRSGPCIVLVAIGILFLVNLRKN